MMNERASDLPFDEESPILKVSRHLLNPNGSISGKQVADVISPRFPTFASAIPLSLPPQPALAGIDGRAPLTHRQIYDFVTKDFGPALHALGFGRGDRIALILPNGSELALAILATAHWASCVPLSANGSITELEADLARCGAQLVIGPYSGPMVASSASTEQQSQQQHQQFRVKDHDRDWSKFRSIEDCANKLNIPLCGIVPSNTRTGIFRLQPTRLGKTIRYEDVPRLPSRIRTDGTPTVEPNTKDDEALLLFTSGTTGDKKLVPHLMGDMLVAATVIALSWDLTPLDMNCNLMPLFHVGGIVRQVFSPVFSGGGVICCPSFDPYIFWALLDKDLFNWYYAAPTMHQLIIQTGRENGFIGEKRKLTLKMIANAAGGLLPSLAEEMREVFGANVLPSYGMTECMPISSPPSTYQLEKPGTSGIAVGPEIAIINTATGEHLKPGEEGAICVRGEPCFRGYGALANGQESETESFLEGGWFSTGDLGYQDEEGYLYSKLQWWSICLRDQRLVLAFLTVFRCVFLFLKLLDEARKSLIGEERLSAPWK
jgi:acyl-CoA synthetase (AMP-forming)/AMP-acid ligase II